MNKAIEDVFAFHTAMGEHIGTISKLPPIEIIKLRLTLLKEEYKELKKAIKEDDLEKIADGVGDLIYVALGTAIAYGIDIGNVWKEIHRTNMLKVGGPRRRDGKLGKPPGWEGPKIKQILENQTKTAIYGRKGK